MKNLINRLLRFFFPKKYRSRYAAYLEAHFHPLPEKKAPWWVPHKETGFRPKD